MSLGVLSGTSIFGMRGLGLDSTPACKAIQGRINVELRKHGYMPIGEDGKCGAATCGAMQELDGKFGTTFLTESGFSTPGVCPKSTPPLKSGGGGGAFSPVPGAELEPTQAGFLGMDTQTLLLIGAVAVGAYVLLGDKKKKAGAAA